MNKPQDLDLLSENSLVVLSKVPPYSVRWGIAVISIILFGIVIMSAIIPFPETIEARVQIQNGKALSKHYAVSNLYLEDIFVAEGDTVKEGELLAEMQVDLHPEKIKVLDEFMALLESSSDTVFIIDQLENLKEMADLQEKLQQLNNALNRRLALRHEDSLLKKADYYEKKQLQVKELILLTEEEIALKKKEKTLAWKRHRTDKSLFLDSVISLEQYRLSREAYLRIESNYIVLEKKLKQEESRLIEIERNHVERTQASIQRALELDLLIEELKVSLRNKIQSIEENRYITAKKAGRVHIYSNTRVGSSVEAKVPLFAIEDLKGEATGIGHVRGDKILKLRIGQKALIELDAYSNAEFGSVEAEIIEIGELLDEDEYQLKLRLTEQANFPLNLKAEMSGKLIIICESKTLFERVFKIKTS